MKSFDVIQKWFILIQRMQNLELVNLKFIIHNPYNCP